MGQIENKASWGPTNIGSGADSSYTYNYAGEIATETDIWGHTYTPAYNSIGQMTSLASSLSDSTHPSPLYSGISYNPLGQIASETFGNGIVRTNTYDADGRITNIADMNGSTQVYGLHVLYGANQISAWHDTVNGYWSPYTYDTFGRLASSNCISTCPNGTNVEAYTYSYDEFGNRWSQAFTPGVSGNSGTTNSATYNNKNQLTPSGCAGGVFCYDAAGNLQMDSLGVTWTHDAEGKLTAWANSSVTATYVYDALGQRMERSLSTGHTDAYATGVLAMTDATSGFASSWWESVGDSIYANSSTYFPSRDNLGTPRLQTDPLGATNSTFYVNIAFGDEGNASHMWGWNFFAGMLLDDPDGDMGHDYVTPNRNYNPTEGRWMIPDPAGLAAVDLTNPQSWNRYAYVLNNPVKFTDPLGLDNCDGKDDLVFRADCGDGAPDPLTLSPGTTLGQQLASLLSVDPPVPQLGGTSLAFPPQNSELTPQDIPGSSSRDGGGDTAMGWMGEGIFHGPGMASFWRATNAFVNQSMVSMTVGGVSGGIIGYGVGQFVGGFIEGYTAESITTTTVGRWMPPSELQTMQVTGLVKEATNGVTHVSVPPNPTAWTPASTGRVFVQFDVPSSCVVCDPNTGWGYIYGPSHIFADRLGITQMPPATNIMPWEF